ncbi:glucose-6-phosphate isomerase [Mesomycoplasma moatsii]|uniref:glucose-6-phosphate isomerase n=1 Tax=Mesomycoplasma moatsii TaxID=171287 RepID=UPI0003B456EA
MKEIKINFNKANLDLKEIFAYADKVKEINEKMEKFEGEGSAFLGWKDLPNNINPKDVQRIEDCAKKLHNDGVEVLVVIGIGGSYLGVRAGIDFVFGEYPGSEKKMEIIYVGESISSTSLVEKLKYVENKKFAINVISKSGTTLEPAIAFRLFKKMLEDKIGKNNAKDYIFATTDASKGLLIKLAEKEGYERFVIPDDVGGRFSVLTPVGLFPFACVGLNIKKIISGAKSANDIFGSSDLVSNLAYQYAVARYILHTKKKYPVEMIVSYETCHRFFLEWWKQLFAESEGKNEKGLLPHSAIFTTDLHSLGQFIQEGSKVLFETILTIKKPKYDLKMFELPQEENNDNLNYLAEKSIHEINNIAFDATIDAHSLVGRVPNIHISIEDYSEESFGTIVMFFERAVAISGYLLRINPFNQPGVEVYKTNMFKTLKKPI